MINSEEIDETLMNIVKNGNCDDKVRMLAMSEYDTRLRLIMIEQRISTIYKLQWIILGTIITFIVSRILITALK